VIGTSRWINSTRLTSNWFCIFLVFLIGESRFITIIYLWNDTRMVQLTCWSTVEQQKEQYDCNGIHIRVLFNINIIIFIAWRYFCSYLSTFLCLLLSIICEYSSIIVTKGVRCTLAYATHTHAHTLAVQQHVCIIAQR
jgi:hypothetical protein